MPTSITRDRLGEFLEDTNPAHTAIRRYDLIQRIATVHGQLDEKRLDSIVPITEVTDIDRWREVQPADSPTAMKVGLVAILYGYETAGDTTKKQPGSRIWHFARQIGAYSARLQLVEARIDTLAAGQQAGHTENLLRQTPDQAVNDVAWYYTQEVGDQIDWWIRNHRGLSASNTRELVAGSIISVPQAAPTIRDMLSFEQTPEANSYIEAVLKGLGSQNLVTNDREAIDRRVTSMYDANSWHITP